MAKTIEKKQQVVEEIAGKLSGSKSTIITDYRGLNVKQASELRKQLREAGVEYKVLKNTLVKRATEKLGLTQLDEHLQGPTAIAFSDDDVVAPAKVLQRFSKENEALKIKGGMVEGRMLGPDDIRNLANLPSREGLLSMLLSVLQAPMRNFALVVKAVADQGGQESAPEEA